MTPAALAFLLKLKRMYGNPAEWVLPGTGSTGAAEELFMLGMVDREGLVTADGEDSRWCYQINNAGYQFLRDQEAGATNA